MTPRRFLRDARGGATAIAAAAVALMTVGGAALITDHVWLVDQRDALKAAADAAGVAAGRKMSRLEDTRPDIGDTELEAILLETARRYVELNLEHLPPDRLDRAKSTLVVEIDCDRSARTVDVSVEADLGGTLLSRHLALIGESVEPRATQVDALAQSVVNPVEVVLAIDISNSMLLNLRGGGDGVTLLPDSRIVHVKRAAAALVDIVEPDAVRRIAIGLVPWHQAVRLDADTAADWSANGWARYPEWRFYGEPYVCRGSGCTPPDGVAQALAPAPAETWNGCLDSHRLSDSGPRASLPATEDFFTAPSARAFAQRFFPAVRGVSYECLTPPLPADYSYQYCYHGTMHLLGSETGYAPMAPQWGCAADNPAIISLSTDAGAIRRAIESLAPVPSRTYSALGVLWGQRLLDHSWRDAWGGDVHPADPDHRDSEGLRKVIVLLTDGDDTHCGPGKPTCANSVHGFERTDACAAAKAAGTEIFVVAAMHPDEVSSSLGKSLRACSSESDDSDATYAFLNNATPESLDAAFVEIATQLESMRRLE